MKFACLPFPLLLMTLTLLAFRANAAPPVLDQTLTTDQAVTIALRESPLIHGAVAEVDAARGRLKAARAETRPTVSANTFVSGGSLPNIVESPELLVSRMIMGLPRGGYADQNLMVMYPLFTSGRLQAMTRQAAALRGASQATLEVQRREVTLMVRVAYREIQAREALVGVGQTRLQENEERLRIDREKLTLERIPAYYVRRDEAEVASAQQEITNARRDAGMALSQLKTVMGISLASRLALTEKLDDTPSADLLRKLTDAGTTADADLAALLSAAERHRPELLAAGERVAGAQAGETAVRAGYRPQVGLFAMGDVLKAGGMPGTGGITYGVTASIPLYSGGGDQARRETAAAERRVQEAEQERIALQIAREVNDAYLSLLAAEQNIQTARAALRAAGDEYRAAKARYDASRSIVTEVLDALTSRVRSENEVIQALFQYNVAADQLRKAVGAERVP